MHHAKKLHNLRIVIKCVQTSCFVTVGFSVCERDGANQSMHTKKLLYVFVCALAMLVHTHGAL